MPVRLSKLAAEAERQHDAKTMAFAALRMPYSKASRHWVEGAINIDHGLGWIYYAIAEGDRASPASEFILHLQQWDPGNAVGYLIEAERLPPGRATKKEVPSAADVTAWRELMAKAFAAPRYETYLARRFDLERDVIGRHGWQQPLALVHGTLNPTPQVKNILSYADHVLHDSYPSTQEQVEACWTVANFGQRMQAGAGSSLERIVGIDLQDKALSRLQRVFNETGRKQEAAIVGFELQKIAGEQLARKPGRRPSSLSADTIYSWTALVVNLSAVVALVSLVLVVGVGALRLFRAHTLTRHPRLMTAGLRCAPVVLVVSAVALLVSYHPYAAMWRYYMTTTPAMQDYDNLGWFIALAQFPALVRLLAQPGPESVYLWWAVIIVGLAICAVLIRRLVKPPAKLAQAATTLK